MVNLLDSEQYGSEANGVNEYTSGGATAFDNEDEVFPERSEESR